MPNYKNGKIYKIVPSQLNEDDPEYKIYIGSHTNPRNCQRMRGHKSKFKSWKDNNKGSFTTSYQLFNEFGIDKCDIVLIEKYPCNNKDELRQREQYYIDELSKEYNVVNKQKAYTGLSKEEYRKKYQENNREQQKEYRENNKDKIKEYQKEYQKEYREDNKEYQTKYREDNREKILKLKKNHYQNNKDKILGHRKEYYQNNKDKINIKVKCECGIELTKKKLKRHQKTNRHQELISNNKVYIKKQGNNKTIVKCECGIEITRKSLNIHKKTKRHQELISKQIKEEFIDIFGIIE